MSARASKRAGGAAEAPQPRRVRSRKADEEKAKAEKAEAPKAAAAEGAAPERAFALSGPGARARIATSGFTLSQPRYWRAFDCLELNATFYRTPKPAVWAGWAAKRPRETTWYVVKAHQYFTHRKRLILDDAFRARWALWWQEHCSLLANAGCLLCLLFQLPPAMAAAPANRERLRDALLAPETSPVASTGVRCAIEFRHSSWHCAEVYAQLRQAGWCLVTTVQNNDAGWAGDLASRVTPPLEAAPSAAGGAHLRPVLTCDWGAYIRFHGQSGQYLGRHGDEQMQAWAERIAPLLHDQGRTVVAAFNNTDTEKPPSAVLDALALGRELRSHGLMDA